MITKVASEETRSPIRKMLQRTLTRFATLAQTCPSQSLRLGTQSLINSRAASSALASLIDSPSMPLTRPFSSTAHLPVNQDLWTTEGKRKDTLEQKIQKLRELEKLHRWHEEERHGHDGVSPTKI